MAPELTSEAWAQIRADYEHTDRPIADICAGHGISSGTLRDRMRRWGWTRRRPPIPDDGPPAAPAPPVEAPALVPAPAPGTAECTSLAPAAETAAPCAEAAPQSAAGAGLAATTAHVGADAGAIVPHLQSAVARVLPAIETIVARLAAGPMPPLEMERAGRALSALTRTLRELNALLVQHPAPAAQGSPRDYDPPEDMDEFRRELARRMDAFVEARTGKSDSGGEPQDA